MDILRLEKKLSALFHGGERRCRELRLTPAEYDYLLQTYPTAGLISLGDSWYELTWKEAL